MLHIAALLLSLFVTTTDLTLTGTVFDPGGVPVPGAHIVALNTTDQTRREATTGADGTYRLDKLPAGSYSVEVTQEGFTAVQTTIKLEVSTILEFRFSRIEASQERVDVVARPEPINMDTVSSQRNVNEAIIQNVPFQGERNFINALTLLPDVLMDNNGQIHVDGSRADQIRYQLDGINITSPSGGLASNVPIDAVENIDLDVSGYSAESGKGSGGVVRVESQFVGDKLRWNVTDFVPGFSFRQRVINQFSPRAIVAGPIVQNKSWFMYSGSLHYTRTFNESLPKNQNRQYQTLGDQLGKFQWNLAEAHVLTLSVLNNNEFYGDSGLSALRPLETTTNLKRLGTTTAASNRDVFHGKLLETTVQWTHRRDSDLAKGTSELIVSPGGWSGNYFTDRMGHDDRLHIDQTVAWEHKTGRLVHRIKAGAEYDYVDSGLQLTRRPFEVLNSADQLELAVQFQGPDMALVHDRELGLFVQDRIVLNPSTQVEIGLREDRESVTGRVNSAPRIAGSYFPFADGHTKFSGGVGMFYDDVPVQDLQLARMQSRITTSYFPDGTVNQTLGATAIDVSRSLANPYGVHWNAQWEQEWAPRWVSRINLIGKRGHDQIRLTSNPSPDGNFDLLFNNSGKSTYKAIELTLDRPIRKDIRVLASYIYSQSLARPSTSTDFPDPSVSAIGLAPTPWNAPHRFISWGYFPIFWHSTLNYAIDTRSGFPFSVVDELGRLQGSYNTSRYPVFYQTNLAIEKELPVLFGKHLALRIGVNNLFNRYNPRFVDNDADSPTFMQFSNSTSRNFEGRIRLIK